MRRGERDSGGALTELSPEMPSDVPHRALFVGHNSVASARDNSICIVRFKTLQTLSDTAQSCEFCKLFL